jgi:SAM-dependent methyltransferase
MTIPQNSLTLFPGFTITEGDTVLDIGCGSGEMCVKVGQIGAAVIALDVDQENLEIAHASMKGIPARSFMAIHSDCGPIPIRDGSATAVIAQEVLEHVDNPRRLVAEMVRVGTAKARYLIAVPDSLSEDLIALVADPSYFQPPNHVHVFGHGEIESFCRMRVLRLYHGPLLAFSRHSGGSSALLPLHTTRAIGRHVLVNPLDKRPAPVWCGFGKRPGGNLGKMADPTWSRLYWIVAFPNLRFTWPEDGVSHVASRLPIPTAKTVGLRMKASDEKTRPSGRIRKHCVRSFNGCLPPGAGDMQGPFGGRMRPSFVSWNLPTATGPSKGLLGLASQMARGVSDAG